MELRWRRFGLEISILVVCCAVDLLYDCGFIPLTRRGFFCDDESIRHPYGGDTLTFTEVLVSSYILTLVLILITEVVIGWKTDEMSYCLCISGPAWIYKSYEYFVGFLLSMALTLVTTDVTKCSIGRLRPCFISLCQPDINLENCTATAYLYISDYNCTNGADKESYGRISFFSAHAAVAVCSAVYAVLYIYERWPRNGVWKFLKAFISFLLILQALSIGMTRILDNMHFPSDVVTGLMVGSLIAFLTARHVNGIGRTKNNSDDTGDQHQQEEEEYNEESPIVARAEQSSLDYYSRNLSTNPRLFNVHNESDNVLPE